MIKEHVAYTNSEVGKEILQMEEKGLSSEQAKIEAFNKIKNGR